MEYCFYCMQPKNGSAVCPYCGKTGTPEAMEHQLPCGTLLRGRYLSGRPLGEGGFGITYIGLDTVLDGRVAIKEYYPNGFAYRSNTASASVKPSSSDERREVFNKGLANFLSEARTLEKFAQEPGVVNVRDFFEENGTAYLVMEYLDGITLTEFIKRGGPVDFNRLMQQLRPVTDALVKMHAAGLIHRDVSPDNIMLTAAGWKLLDFGAARNIFRNGNRSLSVILKPGFAPEEQYRTRGSQGPWTDVYALSATIYKCITGVTPPDSNERMVRDELVPPSALGAAITPAAENALLRGLAVTADSRFQSVSELTAALSPNAAPYGAQPPARNGAPAAPPYNAYKNETVFLQPQAPETAYGATQPSPVPRAGEATAPVYGAAPATPRKKANKGPLVIIAAVLALLLIGGGIFAFFALKDRGDGDDGAATRRNKAESTTQAETEGTDADPSQEEPRTEPSSAPQETQTEATAAVIPTEEPGTSGGDWSTAPADKLFRPDSSLFVSQYTAIVFCIDSDVQDYAKMRFGPSKARFNTVGTIIPNYDTVTVETASVNGWTLCFYNGTEGWVRSDFLFTSYNDIPGYSGSDSIYP